MGTGTARLSTMTHSACRDGAVNGATAGAVEVCGLRIAGADPQSLLDPRTDSERIFLFRGRDVAITMNSVKILHAVRSAITAI